MVEHLQTEFLQCECHSSEHTLSYTFNTEENEIYTSVFLLEKLWYQRIWVGLKYMFGYKCRYGHFDCFSMKRDDVKRLRKLLQEYELAEEQALLQYNFSNDNRSI